MRTIPYPPIRNSYQENTNLLERLFITSLISLIICIAAIPAILFGFEIINNGHIFPGVSVAGIDLGGLSPEEAATKISKSYTYSQTGHILLKDGEKTWSVFPGQLGFFIDPETTALAAYQIGRQGNPTSALIVQVQVWWTGVDLPPVAGVNKRVAKQFLLELSKQTDRPILEAHLGICLLYTSD